MFRKVSANYTELTEDWNSKGETSMQSEQIDSLAKALAAAQAQIHVAKRNQENPFFKNKYADLASVWAACREPLTKNGLSVVQTVELQDGVSVLVTTLLHESGQFIKSFQVLNPVKNDPQGMGSAISYARRYGLAAIAGVATDGEDDDAEAAVDRNNERPTPKEQPKKQPIQQEFVSPVKNKEPVEEPTSSIADKRVGIKTLVKQIATMSVDGFDEMEAAQRNTEMGRILTQARIDSLGTTFQNRKLGDIKDEQLIDTLGSHLTTQIQLLNGASDGDAGLEPEF